jgi:hypothetical protein
MLEERCSPKGFTNGTAQDSQLDVSPLVNRTVYCAVYHFSINKIGRSLLRKTGCLHERLVRGRLWPAEPLSANFGKRWPASTSIYSPSHWKIP